MSIFCADLNRSIEETGCYDDKSSPNCQNCKVKPAYKNSQNSTIKPFNETTSTIKVSKIDRRMAIKRLPEYESDYKELLSARKTGDGALLSKKMVEIWEKWGEEVEAIEHVEELDEYMDHAEKNKKPPLSVKAIRPEGFRDPIREFTSRTGDTVTEKWIEGERLYLEVDIYNASKGELKKDFAKIIEEYKEIMSDISRDIPTTNYRFKWKIWDMCHKEGKNLLQITREVFDLQGNPTYDFAPKYYKQVERAYRNADLIIQSLIPSS